MEHYANEARDLDEIQAAITAVGEAVKGRGLVPTIIALTCVLADVLSVASNKRSEAFDKVDFARQSMRDQVRQRWDAPAAVREARQQTEPLQPAPLARRRRR